MQVGPRTRQGGRRQEYPATAVARTVTTARPLHHAEGQTRGKRGEGQHRGGRSRGVEYPATAVVRTDTTAIPLHMRARPQGREVRVSIVEGGVGVYPTTAVARTDTSASSLHHVED